MSTLAEANAAANWVVGIAALSMMAFAWWYESPKQVARREAMKEDRDES